MMMHKVQLYAYSCTEYAATALHTLMPIIVYIYTLLLRFR